MFKYVANLSISMLLLAVAIASADEPGTPIEVLAQQAELVVVGEVAGVSPSQRLELPGVEASACCDGYFQKYTVRVKAILGQQPGPLSQPASSPSGQAGAAKGAETKTPEAILVYADGPPPGAPPSMVKVDGRKRPFTRWEDFLPVMKQGESWVLVLKSVPNNPGYYLAAQPGNYAPADEETIQRYQQACRPEMWAWGAAVNGLQLAVLNRYPQRTFAENGVTHIRAMVAVRNVSAKPLRVPLYAPDHFLSFVAEGPRNEVLRNTPSEMRGNSPFTGEDIAVIPPGKMLFISASGVLNREQDIELQVTPGTWRITAQYEARRNTSGLRLFWAGCVESRPMPVLVPPSAAAMN